MNIQIKRGVKKKKIPEKKNKKTTKKLKTELLSHQND